MAKKPKTKAPVKKKAPKKTSVKKAVRTAKTVRKPAKGKTAKKVLKKKPAQKTATKQSKKLSQPAKQTARKKVTAKKPGGTPKKRVQTKKPVSKVTARTVSRKTPSGTRRPAASPAHPRIELLRKNLISRREEILREVRSEIAKYIKGETNQLVETALDDGDWSVIDVSADINIRRLETHRDRLLGIDEALMKLREGTYGVCEECGGEITAERLRVMPFAVYCRDCQEKKEQLEKIAREEIIT
jgi:DnaK suppressor protein